jgi:hypothetical protein
VHSSTSSGMNVGAYCSTSADVFLNAASLAILRSYHACSNARVCCVSLAKSTDFTAIPLYNCT